MLRGFDISAYQATTAPSGADFIIVKATEGSGYTNSRYAAQIASAAATKYFRFMPIPTRQRP